MDGHLPAERMQALSIGTLGHFPAGPAIEFEGATISIPSTAQLPDGWISTEEVDFAAFMRLNPDRRVRSQPGRAQLEFDLLVWELYGRSELLSEKLGEEVEITFSLTPPPQKQPRGICFAGPEDADYPATILYSACYDVFINRGKIIDAGMGVAVCTPIASIPPRNVLAAFEAPFEDRKRGTAFRTGCCRGMRPIPREEFLAGVNRARGGPAGTP